jgi:hypothetical protein
MTNPAIFTDLAQAKAYCLKLDRPVTASVAGATWRLFPSGAALREPERFFYEMNQAQQQQAIQSYDGVELHQFAYELDLNGNVTTRRGLRP